MLQLVSSRLAKPSENNETKNFVVICRTLKIKKNFNTFIKKVEK